MRLQRLILAVSIIAVAMAAQAASTSVGEFSNPQQIGRQQALENTTGAGETGAWVPVYRYPATVCVHPGGGGTVTVEVTASLPSKVSAGTARALTESVLTAISAAGCIPLNGPVTGVRQKPLVAAGVIEVVQ